MTEEDFRRKLRLFVAKKYTTNIAAAKAWQVRPQFVGAVLSGKSRPTNMMIEDAGYTKSENLIISYRRIK